MLLWVGLLVSALLTYVAIRGVDFGLLRQALAESNYWWLLPALAMLAIGVTVRALRWRFLFRRETRPPFRAALSALLVGLLFNNILPARAGEAARVVVLNQRQGTSRVEAVGTLVLERALDVLCLLLLLFAIVPWLPPVSWLGPALVIAIAITVVLASAAWMLGRWGARPLQAATRPLAALGLVGRSRAEAAGANLAQGLVALRDWRLLTTGIALTTLSWLCLGLSMWFVLRAFALGLSPVAGLLVAIAVNFGMILPSSPAAVGVFEAAVLVALSAYGVPKEQALGVAVVAHVLNFAPFIIAGSLVLHAHAVALRRPEAAT
ncbi:MAG TPA: lysylphosphatidylglycerol synthase transmembrane domain-containing protein [Gaiellaceae bacterium]|nr:lysylphosphatidylglycerol synthase transmembrane domain-containing protein [Gaiellaceae bacterium]